MSASVSARTVAAGMDNHAALPRFVSALPASFVLSPLGTRIANVLLGADCCFRCVLRFLGCRQSVVHEAVVPSVPLPTVISAPEAHPSNTASAAAALDHDEGGAASGPGAAAEADMVQDAVADGQHTAVPGARVTHAHVCPGCLGLLQIDHASLAADVFRRFSRKSYVLENQTFSISGRMPPQLAVRHRSLALLLKQGLDMDAEADPRDTRESRRSGDAASDPVQGPPQPDATPASQADAPRPPKLPAPVEVKEIFKHLVANAFARESGMSFDVESPFSVEMHVEHPETFTQFEFLTKIPEAKFTVKTTRRKGVVSYIGASAERIAKAASLVSYSDFEAHKQVPPPPVTTVPEISQIGFLHEQIYIAGRYCKLQRGISNSPWVIGGKRLAEDSVEELVAVNVDPFFRVSDHKFSSAGREDADVLMLGRGRPFYLELVNPQLTMASEAELAALQRTINDANRNRIAVHDLQLVSKDSTMIMKRSADTKSKSYACLVEFEKPVPHSVLEGIAARGSIPLKQRNPTRVPRRADLVRDKMIEAISFEPRETVGSDDPAGDQLVKVVLVRLKTSAGTYVKEFVHGDGGRTEPSLASLAGPGAAKVIELDVLQIHLDWPEVKQRD